MPCPYQKGLARYLGGLLDGEADAVAPFGPGAVVVAHPTVAQELVQDEPGVAGALADAAVDDDVLVGGDALATVEGLEVVGGLEGGGVGIDRLRPGDRLGAGDVAAAQRSLLGVIGHVHELAGVLAGGADVDEGLVGGWVWLAAADVSEDVVAEGADVGG